MGTSGIGRAIALSLLLSVSVPDSSVAQQAVPDEQISEKVINPIEFLMRFTAENKYSPSRWNSHGEENNVEGQLVVPFDAFARQNLARIKIFFETSAPDGTHGLSESEIFNLVLFQRRWGTFGVGATVHLSAQTSGVLGTIAPGPAIGAVAKRGKLKYGLFNQNFLSDTLAQMELQPILGYAFDRKWSAEIGDAQYTYDWKKHRMTSIPLSGQLNRIFSRAKEDIHLFFRAEYNVKNVSGSTMWTLQTGLSLIPKTQ
jgi:hypothetical protein